MAVSATQIVRLALQAWAHDLLCDLFEAVTVEGGPVLAGEAPPLPTLGLEWGGTKVHGRVVDEEVLAGGAVLRLWYEDVDIAFVWRATTPEQADLFAHEFATRAARDAMLSNPDGNRVLSFEIELAPDVIRDAKLYLDGSVVPAKAEENATRSLYTFRVAGAVSYPVIRVEHLGVMNLVVVINGHRFELADFEEAQDA